MRLKAVLLAMAATGCLVATPCAAASSSLPGPDINGATPRARLSPSGTRDALREVAARLIAGAAQRHVQVGDLPAFVSYPYNVQLLPPGQRSLYFMPDTLIPLIDNGLHDADGVRMFDYRGQLWNHVSRQACYGLDNLNAYRMTGNTTYLARAEAQAQRLIDRNVDVGGAWFHPYDFAWGSLQPPWYSSLGQGVALSLFARLYELTGEATYKDAADATFASFLQNGPIEGPWVADVDPSGHLWLQEYPNTNLACVYNGHMVATLALYDYWRVTGNERALDLFRGAATTAADYAASFRRVGWRSLYCLVDPITASPAYHETVVQQFLALFMITGDARFARLADNFENDYPRDAVSGRATVAAGKRRAFKFTGAGNISSQRIISSRKTLHFAVTLRRRIQNRPGYWLRIASGAYRGYLIQESAPKVFMPGEIVTMTYSPTRALTLPGGATYTFHRYAVNGAVMATIGLTLNSTATATLQVSARAIVNGMPQVCASGGPFAGYWICLKGCKLT